MHFLHHPDVAVFVRWLMNGIQLRIWCNITLLAPLIWAVEHLDVKTLLPEHPGRKGLQGGERNLASKELTIHWGDGSDTSGEANKTKAIHHELFFKFIVCTYDIPGGRIPGSSLLCVSVLLPHSLDTG